MQPLRKRRWSVIGAPLSEELTTDLLVSVSGRVSSEASGKMSFEIFRPSVTLVVTVGRLYPGRVALMVVDGGGGCSLPTTARGLMLFDAVRPSVIREKLQL